MSTRLNLSYARPNLSGDDFLPDEFAESLPEMEGPENFSGLVFSEGRALFRATSEETREETSAWYLRSVGQKSTLLSKEEELALAKKVAQGDVDAKRKLAKANLRLVISIAKRYAGKGACFMDLVQEGNLGLMKAVEKFNYRLGYRFSTYATWWIKQSVFQAFAEHDRPIRLPGHVVDSVINLRKARHTLKEGLGRLATDSELAVHLGISIKKVQQLTRAAQRMMSLEAELTLKDGNTQTLGETLEDDRLPDPEQTLFRQKSLQMLEMALLRHLDERERDILLKRYGIGPESESAHPDASDRMTLEEIGRHYGVTRECIRQTEIRAIRKLRSSSFLQQLID